MPIKTSNTHIYWHSVINIHIHLFQQKYIIEATTFVIRPDAHSNNGMQGCVSVIYERVACITKIPHFGWLDYENVKLET